MKFFSMLLAFLVVGNILAQVDSNKLDSLVHRYDSLGGFNGAIIALSPGSEVINLYGYRDPDLQKERLSVDDRFDLASLTKPFTGLTILRLIDQGKISPDDNIGKYFPELKPALQQVTVRQLANHTNGIHDYYSLASDHENLSGARVMELLSALDTTVFSPGSKWGYSNSGYVLLSMLVERVAQVPFQEYCTREVLAPLGILSPTFAPSGDVAPGFTAKLERVSHNRFVSGAAGINVSAHDMAACYHAFSTDGTEWNSYLFMAEKMADQSKDEGWTYGFGWYFSEDGFGKFRAHSGRNEGAYNYIRWYPESNVFICILSNKNDEFIRSLREEVCGLVTKSFKN